MAPAGDARWDRWRNAIHTLYVVEKKPLTGKNGVMSAMKEKHNFEASKPQYERRLAKWGFIKKTTKESWQIGNYKVKKRKDERKETLVYREGVLIPPEKAARELTRQGHMTAIESARMELGPSPRTPAGFDFRTPSEGSVVRLDLEGLPVLQYLRTIQGFAGLFPEPSPSSLSNNQIVHASGTTVRREAVGNSALVGLNLPLSTLEDGTAQPSPLQQACRMVFVVSNNLSKNADKSNVYQWLEHQGLPATSEHTVFRGPTGEALLEKLFRMAVEIGHLGVVKQLLAAGADPNESLCSAPGCPVMLTPLQYACLVGNTPLVRVLHDAGALVNENPFGWQGSILVLAMLRYRLQPGLYLHKNHQSCFGDNECRSNCYIFKPSDGTKRAAILVLVNILLSLGAEVDNPGRWVDERPGATSSDEEYHDLTYLLTSEARSPLMIAAAYGMAELVEVLFRAGADVHCLVDGAGCALQQGEYSVHRKRMPPTLSNSGRLEFHWYSSGSGDPIGADMLYSPLDYTLACGSPICMALAKVFTSTVSSLTVHTIRLAVFRRDFDMFSRVVILFNTPFSRAITLLESGYISIFGSTYSKGTFFGRVIDKVWVLGSLLMAPESDFKRLFRNPAFEMVLSNYNIACLERCVKLEEVRSFHAKLELLRRLDYLGAEPRFAAAPGLTLTGKKQKATNETSGSMRRRYSAASAAAYSENEDRRGSPPPFPPPVTHETRGPSTIPPRVSRPVYGCCDLAKAIALKDWALVSQLRDAGTPLSPRCKKGHVSPLGSMIVVGAPLEVVRSFLEGGADPDVGTCDGGDDSLRPSRRVTPLLYAIGVKTPKYREALVLLLLQHGADPALVTSYHVFREFVAVTPMIVAIRADDSRVAGILLDYGAGSSWSSDPAVPYSPLQLVACQGRGEWVRLFLDRGADPNDVPPEALSPQRPPNHPEENWAGFPVQSAVAVGSVSVVEILLKGNARPDLTTHVTPHTALQIACRERLDSIARLLVEYGADVNAPPAERHGATALQFAAINCRMELAQMLVQKGADVNAPPAAYKGRTALEGAAEHGRIDMVQYLVNVGADTSGGQFERALERARSNGHFSIWNLLVSYLS